MSDVLTPEQRSYCMSRIRGRDTKPEVLLRKSLWHRGLRGYRVDRKVHGRLRADIVFIGPRVAVFVDGCFWHGCPKHFQAPKKNATFWEKKIAANQLRDRLTRERLEEDGWFVLRYWEHEVKRTVDDIASDVERVVRKRVLATKS